MAAVCSAASTSASPRLGIGTTCPTTSGSSANRPRRATAEETEAITGAGTTGTVETEVVVFIVLSFLKTADASGDGMGFGRAARAMAYCQRTTPSGTRSWTWREALRARQAGSGASTSVLSATIGRAGAALLDSKPPQGLTDEI